MNPTASEAERQTAVDEIVAQVRRLTVSTRRSMRANGGGAWRSKFRGQGMEFEEVRQYEAGDDVRHIDWAATARTNDVLLKTFREERELQVLLVVDLSASMMFASTGPSKQYAAAAVAANIALAASESGDRVGVITFDSEIRQHRRPAKGRTHALRLISDCP